MRIQPILTAVATFLVIIVSAFWYVDYANRTHPAPWPMALGDAGRRNYSVAPFPTKPKLLWSYQMEDARTAGLPVAGVDGAIYVPWGSTVTAVGPDGKRRWTWRGDSDVYSLALGRQGTVYALTEKTVYALGPDGAMQWQAAYESGPAGFLLVGQGGVIYTQARSFLYAIADNGTVKWRFRLNRPMAVPVEMEDGRIVVVDETKLYAIEADGDLAWQRDVGQISGSSDLMSGLDGNIYVRSRTSLLVLNRKGETVQEVKASPAFTANLASGKGFVQDGLVRYGNDGKQMWAAERHPAAGFAWSSVDSKGNLLLVQVAAPRASSPPPPLTMLDGSGKGLWTFDGINPVSVPAFTRDGRICLAGYQTGAKTPSLVCIGNQ